MLCGTRARITNSASGSSNEAASRTFNILIAASCVDCISHPRPALITLYAEPRQTEATVFGGRSYCETMFIIGRPGAYSRMRRAWAIHRTIAAEQQHADDENEPWITVTHCPNPAR